MWTDTKIVQSAEGNVAKYVFSKDNAVAEAVLYRYPDFKTRTVICCSSQSGCPVGCRFCGAGDYFVRSLSAEEIVSQAVRCVNDTEVPASDMGRLQIMFMSMGEPLLNQKGMEGALRTLHAYYPNAALLISTSAPAIDYGWVNAISKQIPTIGLQFSVHESTDERRDDLIPFKKKLNLRQIAAQGEEWFRVTGRKPFFNYCAGPDNSTDADAMRLADLFDPMVFEATISVISERNDGLPARSEYQRSLAEDFSGKLINRGYNVRVFDPAGQDDIGGGCGQLWFVQDWMKQNPEKARPSIGCGRPEVHAPITARKPPCTPASPTAPQR